MCWAWGVSAETLHYNALIWSLHKDLVQFVNSMQNFARCQRARAVAGNPSRFKIRAAHAAMSDSTGLVDLRRQIRDVQERLKRAKRVREVDPLSAPPIPVQRWNPTSCTDQPQWSLAIFYDWIWILGNESFWWMRSGQSCQVQATV
jgi:hypothetical protein